MTDDPTFGDDEAIGIAGTTPSTGAGEVWTFPALVAAPCAGIPPDRGCNAGIGGDALVAAPGAGTPPDGGCDGVTDGTV